MKLPVSVMLTLISNVNDGGIVSYIYILVSNVVVYRGGEMMCKNMGKEIC